MLYRILFTWQNASLYVYFAGDGRPASGVPEQAHCSAGPAAPGDKVHQGGDPNDVQGIQAGEKKEKGNAVLRSDALNFLLEGVRRGHVGHP